MTGLRSLPSQPLAYIETRGLCLAGRGTFRMDTRGECLARYKVWCQAAMDGSCKCAPMPQSRVRAQRGLTEPSFNLLKLDLPMTVIVPAPSPQFYRTGTSLPFEAQTSHSISNSVGGCGRSLHYAFSPVRINAFVRRAISAHHAPSTLAARSTASHKQLCKFECHTILGPLRIELRI